MPIMRKILGSSNNTFICHFEINILQLQTIIRHKYYKNKYLEIAIEIEI